eukprot:Phypoly_transcript_06289.p1 GENE.Phypoly_transcript_06289~~Phypoly_transcript_06289.p1  ORF type:complete len:577 (+),score=63.06 Phypoly_transcript_06289:22-1731(+)
MNGSTEFLISFVERAMKVIWVVFLVGCVFGQDDLNVKTIYGSIVGKVSTSGLYKVWNTRYAQSPAGANRWKSPVPLIPWDDTIDASQNPPICPQPSTLFSASESEDCLFLSVYVPIKHSISDTPLPVQVFIHGGAFATGGAIYYNGEILAGDDVIFVSINYRLGALGFLAHPVLYTPENGDGVGFYGIQDQRAALQWIQDNIQFFGGDKTRVTVSGESAGAISVSIHLASPLSAGLFQQAIVQSGSFVGINTKETGFQIGQTVVDAVNCNTSADILACLLSANATELNAAVPMIFPSLASELTRQPIDVITSDQGLRVPLLIGTNAHELSYFLCSTAANITAEQYGYTLQQMFQELASFVLQVYPASSYATPVAAYIDVLSDYHMTCSTRKFADYYTRNGSAPVFMYFFNNQPSYFLHANVTERLFQVSDPQCLGAAHAFDIPYLFDLYDVVTQLSLNATELALRATMRNAWASFVKDGVPTVPSLSWPLYNSQSAEFMNLNAENLSVGSQFRTNYCRFWNPQPDNSTTDTNSTSCNFTTVPTSRTSSALEMRISWVCLLLGVFLALLI